MESRPSLPAMMIGFRRIKHSPSHVLGSLVFALLFFMGGCASPTNPVAILPNTNSNIENKVAAYVTLPVDDPASEYEVVRWLRTGGVHMEKDANGDERIFDSPECRAIFVRYRRMLHVSFEVITSNIANIDTTLDEKGGSNPYRRLYVVGDASGTIEIKTDASPGTVRYMPGHPAADINGYVRYPNVDLKTEQLGAAETSRLYRMVTRILIRFDPTFVDVYCDEVISGQPGAP